MVSAASAGAAVDREPKPHADAADAGSSPLDIRSIAMGQRGIELVLRITTELPWETSQLSSPEGRSLCVKLFYGAQPTPRSRVCFFDRGGEDGPGLTLSRLDPFGNLVSNTIIDANVRRTDERSVQAIFAPSSVYLSHGRYSWQAQSDWSCADPAACTDLAPDLGNVIAQIKPLAEPRCFGAAARNPRYRCINPDLRREVVPTPEVAALSPNARCTIVSQQVPYTCRFGVRSGIADRTIALIGDSHAAHWRAAIDTVMLAKRWHGISFTKAGCPLSTAVSEIPEPSKTKCKKFKRQLFKWFEKHPEVTTVITSNHTGGRVVGAEDDYAAHVEGYTKALKKLPPTVTRIFSIRDTPRINNNNMNCVAKAIRKKIPAGPKCALPRSYALQPDPAVVAARSSNPRRVQLIDMTRFMCSSRLCMPVIGGALVHKDVTHLTRIFATTLGPYLLRHIDRALSHMATGTRP